MQWGPHPDPWPCSHRLSSLSNVKSDFLVVLNQHADIILKTLGFEAWRGKQIGETTLQDPRVLESNCSARHDSLVVCSHSMHRHMNPYGHLLSFLDPAI